jgi:uncharacterized protein (DUF1684 family)
MPPLYSGIPRNQALFRGFVAGGFRIASHFAKGGHFAAIQANNSSFTHRVARPSFAGFGNFPADNSLKIVARWSPSIAAAWAASTITATSSKTASLVAVIFHLLHFPL